MGWLDETLGRIIILIIIVAIVIGVGTGIGVHFGSCCSILKFVNEDGSVDNIVSFKTDSLGYNIYQSSDGDFVMWYSHSLGVSSTKDDILLCSSSKITTYL